LRDLWRRWGAAGLAARAWSRTAGRIADVTVVLEWDLPAGAGSPPPADGLFRCRAIRASEESPEARQAAALLRVDLRARSTQDLFVATTEDGTVVGCTWNDPPEAGQARHRGVAVAPAFRGRGVAGALLLHQVAALAGAGARRVCYRSTLWNRAARRMFDKLGARGCGSVLVLEVLGRRLAAPPLPATLDRRLRRLAAPAAARAD